MRKCILIFVIFTAFLFSNGIAKTNYGFCYGRYMTGDLPSMWESGNVFGVIASTKLSPDLEVLMPILAWLNTENDSELGELKFKNIALHADAHYYPFKKLGLFFGGGINYNMLNYHKKGYINDEGQDYVVADVIDEIKFGYSPIVGYQTSFGLFIKAKYNMMSGLNTLIVNIGFLF